MEEVAEKVNTDVKPDENESVTKRKKFLPILAEGGFYLGVFLLALILFLTVKPLYAVQRNGAVAQSIEVASIGVTIVVGIFLYKKGKLSYKTATVLLLVIGVMLRIGYMLYTPANARQQDTFTKNFDGHEAYAWTVFSTGKLPSVNAYQFYHPPLNALVQSCFMHFMQGLTGGLSKLFSLGDYFPNAFQKACPDYLDGERYFLFSTCQILAVMYSVVSAVVSLKILRLVFKDEKTRFLCGVIVVLFPRNMQFSGMLNNDGITFMCSMLALYFALKWWKQGKRLSDILLCGLFVGLGMMGKLSSATVCLPIGGIFVYEFVRTLKKKEGAVTFWKSVLEYGLFLVVCAPIGLWFQVYAKIRFDQSFGFVFSNLNKKLYTGDHNFFERFFIAFDFKEYFGSLYCKPFSFHYNLFNYALRSSLFGEFSYWQGEGFAVSAILFAYVYSLTMLFSLVYLVVVSVKDGIRQGSFRSFGGGVKKLFGFDRGEERGKDILFTFLLVLSQVGSEIYFYIKMPYGCTMDFRYIMPLITGTALCVGLVAERLKERGTAFSKVLSDIIVVFAIGTVVLTSAFYCVCI